MMKLRVKNNLSGTREVLQIDENSQLKQLKAALRESLAIG